MAMAYTAIAKGSPCVVPYSSFNWMHSASMNKLGSDLYYVLTCTFAILGQTFTSPPFSPLRRLRGRSELARLTMD